MAKTEWLMPLTDLKIMEARRKLYEIILLDRLQTLGAPSEENNGSIQKAEGKLETLKVKKAKVFSKS